MVFGIGNAESECTSTSLTLEGTPGHPREAAPWEGETALMQPLAVCKDSLPNIVSHTFLDSLAIYFGVSGPRNSWDCVFLQWGDGVASAQILELDLGLNPVCHPPVTSYLPSLILSVPIHEMRLVLLLTYGEVLMSYCTK